MFGRWVPASSPYAGPRHPTEQYHNYNFPKLVSRTLDLKWNQNNMPKTLFTHFPWGLRRGAYVALVGVFPASCAILKVPRNSTIWEPPRDQSH